MKDLPIIFSGSSNVKLAQDLCRELNIDLGRMEIIQFPDREICIEILEEVRGNHVFIVQSIVGEPNHFLCELLIIIDAIKRSSAKSITAVIPYLGYCRQDRKNKPGTPITAKLIAKMLSTAGITNLITCDLHSDQIEGFFETNVDHIHCQELFQEPIKTLIGKDSIVVAPDIGSIKIAERMAKFLDTQFAVIKKERINPFDVRMTLIGDISRPNVLIIDDLCSTANTLVEAASLCKQLGAKKVVAAVTHGLFVGDAIQKIENSILERLFVTDTVKLHNSSACIHTVSIAPILAAAIRKFI